MKRKPSDRQLYFLYIYSRIRHKITYMSWYDEKHQPTSFSFRFLRLLILLYFSLCLSLCLYLSLSLYFIFLSPFPGISSLPIWFQSLSPPNSDIVFVFVRLHFFLVSLQTVIFFCLITSESYAPYTQTAPTLHQIAGRVRP